MQFYRFMSADRFLGELKPLRAYRTEFMGTGLLESLDATGLLRPRIRARYPEAVARRFWLESHEHVACQMKLPTEPDGPRWDAAVDLSNAFFRWENSRAYGPSLHPLDDPEPRFVEFIQQPKDFVFERWSDRRVDVSSDVYDTLFDNCNIEDYYSSWQVLFAAEVADAGIHIRLNLADEAIFRDADVALRHKRIPEAVSYSLNFLPILAARDFAAHEKALDAVVWFAEERWRVLSEIRGMTIAVEHVAVALGATETQLYEKFKQLWRDADVLRILKRGDVAPLARTTQVADGWPSLRVKIYALRDEPGGKLAADLVMAHRIRGSVHTALAEDDPLELEALFIGLMRAALLTYVEVRGNDPSAVVHMTDNRPK